MTFVASAAREAVGEFEKKYGSGAQEDFIRRHILQNFYAFELMMAPYAVGHLKMSFFLEELGHRLADDERVRLYLTNTLDMEELEIRGENLAEMRVHDFKMPATFGTGDGLLGEGPVQPIIRPLFKNAFAVTPFILKDACAGCGICIKSCPVSAITLKDNIADIDHNKCIRCYCCHEMCPHHSIELKRSALYKILSKAI